MTVIGLQGPWNITTIRVLQGSDFQKNYFPLISRCRPPANQQQQGTGPLENAIPYNYTGATVYMNVRQDQDPSATLLLTLDNGVNGGLTLVSGGAVQGTTFVVPSYPNGLQITILAATSLGLSAGTYYYDLFCTTSTGSTTCHMAGNFEVMATVSRTVS